MDRTSWIARPEAGVLGNAGRLHGVSVAVSARTLTALFAVTLLLGCAANPEPAPMGAMNMGMQMGMECPMHADMQCPMTQGMHMPNASMETEVCPCPGCAAAQDQPAP